LLITELALLLNEGGRGGGGEEQRNAAGRIAALLIIHNRTNGRKMAGQTSDSCFAPFAIYAGRVNFGPIARRSDILVKYAGRRMPRISSSYRPISAARALRQQQTRRPPLPLLSIDERDRGTDTRTFYDAYRPNYADRNGSTRLL